MQKISKTSYVLIAFLNKNTKIVLLSMFCFIFASFLFENATPSTIATFVGLQTQLLGKSNFRSSNYFKASLVDKRNLDAGPMIRVGGWGLALELRWQLLPDPKP